MSEAARTKGLQIVLAKFVPDTPAPGEEIVFVPGEAVASLFVAFENRAGAVAPPKLGVSLLTVPKSTNRPVLAGYGRLDSKDFGAVAPRPQSVDTTVRLFWERSATLRSLDRAGPQGEGFKPDVVVYGPGGEVLPRGIDE
jgi:hypothetical protein